MSRFCWFKELNSVAVVKLRSRSRSGEDQDPINKHLDSRSRTMFTPAALVLRNRLEDGVLMRNVLTWWSGWVVSGWVITEDWHVRREEKGQFDDCMHPLHRASSQLFNWGPGAGACEGWCWGGWRAWWAYSVLPQKDVFLIYFLLWFTILAVE